MQQPAPLMRNGDTSPLTLLLVASSPSDLTELEGTARALANRGHHVTIAYFYSGGSRQIHLASLEKLRAVRDWELNVQTVSVNVDRRLTEIQAQLCSARPTKTKHISDADKPKERPAPWRQRVRKGLQTVGLLRIAIRMYLWTRTAWRLVLRVVRAARRVFSRFMMLRLPTVYACIATVQLLRIYRSYGTMFRALLSQRPFQAIVVPEDIVGPFWPQLIKVGRKLGIQTIVLPYTLANREEAFKSLRDKPDFQTRYNRLAATMFPRWRMRQDGYDIVRLPAGHIFAHKILGLSPPDPWMMNSGHARMICVDSPASFDYFRRSDIPAKRLTVTGSVSQDQLAHAQQRKAASLQDLRKQLGLAGEKPLLLISGCPNQLAGAVPHRAFANMREVAEHLSAALRPLAAHYDLVVRPHPNYPEFGAYMQSYGTPSSLVPTAQLVPLCDLFIAFASATIRWAAACGTPTVNYDIFHYGYSDFAANKGVLTVSEPQKFIDLLARMHPESPDYRQARLLSKSDAPYWSVMDGRGLERIEDALREAAMSVRH